VQLDSNLRMNIAVFLQPNVESGNETSMQKQKLTPWFNAKKHSPVRDGWYDCKECNVRHYFRDGHWYRDKRSLKNGGYMTIYNMHWRGQLGGTAQIYEPDMAPLARSEARGNWIPAETVIAKLEAKLAAARERQIHRKVRRSLEEQEWLDMAPISREFGSPDYERLMDEDSRKIRGPVLERHAKDGI